jgi:hypothetical protein
MKFRAIANRRIWTMRSQAVVVTIAMMRRINLKALKILKMRAEE